jgi:hypothetical protein
MLAAMLVAGCSNAEVATNPSSAPVVVGAASAGGDGGGLPDAAPAGAEVPIHATEPLPRVLLFNLRSAPFPGTGHPDVAVHVPIGFEPRNHPGLVVFFHGFDNCVANVVGSVDTECTADAGTRSAMHLVDQLDAAHVNAILVAVQLRYDQSTGDPGQLAQSGDFAALVHELMTEHLAPLLGAPVDVGDFDPVVVGTHSGGYEAAASVLSGGGVVVREVDLYDSLYGETTVFDDWVKGNVTRLDPARPDAVRWMDVYTATGGTDTNSQDMATAAAGWLDAADAGTDLIDDRTTDTLGPADYAHPVVFKLSALAHNDVPRYYFEQFARTGFLTPLP